MFSALYFAYSSFDWRNVLKNGILPIEVFFDYVLLIGYLMNNARRKRLTKGFILGITARTGVLLLFYCSFFVYCEVLAWGVSVLRVCGFNFRIGYRRWLKSFFQVLTARGGKAYKE